MQLDRSLGAPGLGPVKYGQGKVNEARIQAHEFVREAKLPPLIPAGDRRVAFCQELPEYGLIEAPRPVLVRIGER